MPRVFQNTSLVAGMQEIAVGAVGLVARGRHRDVMGDGVIDELLRDP